MPPACSSCHGRLSCSQSISRAQGQRLLFTGGGVLRLPHTWLLSQAEGMLGQRVFRSMRVSSTELRRLAQASSSSSIPYPTLISQGTLCFPGGMPRQRGFRCMRVSPTARLGSCKLQQPAEYFSVNAVLLQRLWIGADSTSLLLPQQGFSRVREEELRESWCLLGLAFQGSMFASWVHQARSN